MRTGYTYITEIKTSRRTMYYGGKKLSGEFIPSYFGSGKVVKTIKRTGKAVLSVTLHAWHESQDEINAAEKELIARLRQEHGKLCVNINDGGDGFDSEMSRRIENTPSMKARRVDAIKKAWTQDRREAAAERSREMLKNETHKQAFISGGLSLGAREKRSKIRTAKWRDDDAFKTKMLSVLKSDHNRSAISNGQKLAWKDPDIRKRRSTALSTAFADLDVRRRMRDACAKACNTPEARETRRKNALAMWSDPKVKAERAARMQIAMNTPEAAAKRAAAIKAAWARRKALATA